ncbi:MAG: TlpA family protein disulfide reductase [Clostridia bacterium]|nr:TlpA family protein disulfide reductase [Clostridia bacterium]
MKKIIITIFAFIILVGTILGTIIWYRNKPEVQNSGTNNNSTNNVSNVVTDYTTNTQIIKTNSNSTLRVVNYYDETMFKGKNTILFMWASWCPNCNSELDDLNEILKKYKNDKDVNIVFIAHERPTEDGNLDNLINLLESGTIDFDTEILVDFGRVIRKHLDPEEAYIPRTYFLDKNCNILEEIETTVTTTQIDELINKYYK